jgi:galactokinase
MPNTSTKTVSMNVERISASFRSHYDQTPVIAKSPGRINIIGEHTDYNNGYVMPAAIDKAIYVAVAKRDDDEIHLFSEGYQQSYIANIHQLKRSEKGWVNYLLGVADQLQKFGYALGGFNLYIDGDVPLGAGLSSSAAVECATGYALGKLFGLEIPKPELAKIAQKAEQLFAGVNCGIMDQFASVFGRKGYAVLLDCRSMDYNYIPLSLDGHKLVLFNTNVKHSLSNSAYNTRREQCEKGVALVKAHHPAVENLRDVTAAMLEEHVKPVDEEVYQKCSYVVAENERVITAVAQLKAGNLKGLGEAMFATHEGLSKTYEVSCEELDFLVDSVKPLPDVLGARMMGGGFGGCTINIIKDEAIDDLIENLTASYAQKFNLKLDAYIVETGDGSTQIL